MKITLIPLEISLFTILALIIAPLISPSYAIYTGTYFHNNLWNFGTTLFGTVILCLAAAGVYTAILAIKFNAAYYAALMPISISLIALAFYGIYSPFVITATITGVADTGLIITANIISFQWGASKK